MDFTKPSNSILTLPVPISRPPGPPTGVQRVCAYLVDIALIYAAQSSGGYAGGILAGMMTDPELPQPILEDAISSGVILGWAFWGVAIWVLNYVVIQGSTGGTAGKIIFGLQIVRSNGAPIGIFRALARTLCYWVSAIPMYFGFLAALIRKDKRGWHDLVCDTKVVLHEYMFARLDMDETAVTSTGKVLLLPYKTHEQANEELGKARDDVGKKAA